MGFSLKGVIGGVAGFALGGPAGAAAGYKLGSSLGSSKPSIAPAYNPQDAAYPFQVGGIKIGTPVFPPGNTNVQNIISPPILPPYIGAGGGGGGGGTMAVALPPGCRPNKSTYVTRGGGTSKYPKQLQLHLKGTTCVKRRAMNAGNGKAATRAVRRLVAFYRLSSRVAKQLRRAAVKAHVGGGRRGQRRLPAGRGVEVVNVD